MTWADNHLVAFDLETTGLDVETDRIVTASVVHLHPGKTPVAYEYLADPGIEIPVAASGIHGVTTQHAREHGMRAVEVIGNVFHLLAEAAEACLPIVVYNAPYDLTLLDRECRRHNLPTLDDSLLVVDPLVIDRHEDPYRSGPRKLTHLCQRVYGVDLPDTAAHGSTADAVAAARVAWKMARRYPHLGDLTLSELHGYQRGWYREWAVGYSAYLTSQGRPSVIDLEWPYRPVGAAHV